MKKTMKSCSGSKKTHKNNLGSNFTQQVVTKFLQMLITVKLYHWNTFSYATHKATDDLYSKINDNIDSFIEVLLGKHSGSRIILNKSKSISLHNYNSNNEFKKEIDSFTPLHI